MPKALKSCPKSNKSPNLVTLPTTPSFPHPSCCLRATQYISPNNPCLSLSLSLSLISETIFQSVWPDLAKFHRFGMMLKNFGHFWMVLFVFGTILTYFDELQICFRQIFFVVNGQVIWSHCYFNPSLYFSLSLSGTKATKFITKNLFLSDLCTLPSFCGCRWHWTETNIQISVFAST